MGKNRRKGSKQRPEAFERFYADLYEERWPGLRAALLGGDASVAFDHNLERPYYLDPASILAAAALTLGPAHRVLDLCAAPGGKSLVLASALDEQATLVCNERSSARRARLHRVLDEHLGPARRSRVRITGHDAARWALYEPASCDRVLADVPCSSEQHVLQSAGALGEWSPSRTVRLARGAYAIACAAADTLRPGGRMVYATCALSPLENDGVIGRLLERSGDVIERCEPAEVLTTALRVYERFLTAGTDEAPGELPGEPTELGWMILPDADRGLGPMYIAVLDRSPG